MFGKKDQQKQQKKTSRRNMPAFVVVLVLALILPLFLIALSLFSVLSNSALKLSQMGMTAGMLAKSMDHIVDQMSQIESDFFTITNNRLRLAGELFERGEFTNHPENIHRVFGDMPFYIVNPDGVQIAGLDQSPLEAGEVKSLLSVWNKETEKQVLVSSEGYVSLRKLPDGNYIYSINEENRDIQFLGNIGGLEDNVLFNNEAHTSIIVTQYDMVASVSGPIGIVPGEPLNDRITALSGVEKTRENGVYTYGARIDNRLYLVIETPENDHSMKVYYTIALTDLVKESVLLVGIVFLIVLFGLTIVMYFVYIFRKVHSLDDPGAEKELKYKSLILMIASVAVTAVSSYYAKTLMSLKTYVLNDDEELEILENRIHFNRSVGESLQKQFDDVYSEQTSILANYLCLYPEERTKERLQDFSTNYDIQYSILFDQNGNELVSDADYITLSLSKNKNDMSNQFWSVLNGTPVLASEIGTDDLTGLRHLLIGAKLQTSDGQPDGFLMTAYSSDAIDTAVKSYSLETTLDYQCNSQQNDYFLIDPETHEILFSPYFIVDGENALDVGFEEEKLQEGYSGSVRVFDTKYAITQRIVDGKYLYVALPFSKIYGDRISFAAFIGLGTLLLYLISAALMHQLKMKEPTEEEVKHFITKRSTSRDHILNKNLYAEEKTTRLIGELMAMFGLILFLVVLFRHQLLSNDSIIIYILNGNWRPGLNIFALTAVLILVLVTIVLVRFALIVLTLSMRIASPQSETYLRLAKSAVEYLSVLICGYVAFMMLGVKMETLLATSSIMALLVGMGAQDLTQDIIAGLFLMFESEFQIGDVIDVNGKIGTVKEIGLHSTKLIDENNNILLLNNSNVRNIINRTKNTSMTFSSFTLSTDIAIRQLEEIFAQELPPLKQKHPQFVKEPFFMGVDKFNGGSMECTVAAETTEDERYEAEQILNSEVQIILLRHGITIG